MIQLSTEEISVEEALHRSLGGGNANLSKLVGAYTRAPHKFVVPFLSSFGFGSLSSTNTRIT